jgi:hypothetical protein
VSGVVEGGWDFVAAAYLLTAVVLTGYATSVFLRYRSVKNRAATDAARQTRV